jgi:hypothetical protein
VYPTIRPLPPSSPQPRIVQPPMPRAPTPQLPSAPTGNYNRLSTPSPTPSRTPT